MLIESLSRLSGLSNSQLMHIADTASRRYKSYTIPKKSGGVRVIHHPSRQLKAIQRWLNSAVFERLEIHPRAMAYRKGRNIADNAVLHKDSNFTLRMDFKSFFPSFHFNGVSNFIQEQNVKLNFGMSDTDVYFVTKIVSRSDELTIGAPSSPILTNTMMYRFDEAIQASSVANGAIYTRYADDLFFSADAPELLVWVQSAVNENAESFPFAKLVLNSAKTTFLTKKRRRMITGLVITTDRRVSIGRARKRIIKSLIYKYIQGELDADKVLYVKGWIGFAQGVEPQFYQSLSKKYGPAVLSQLAVEWPENQSELQ